MKPHPVGATEDLHMIDLHIPESANIIAEWLDLPELQTACLLLHCQADGPLWLDVKPTEGNKQNLIFFGQEMFSAMVELDLISKMSYLEYKHAHRQIRSIKEM